MNIETLKQGLQQILNEDLSNRSSISELRRNVFLHTSKTEQTESMLASKEKAISDLSSDIAYYKNQISLREKSIEENAGSFKAERDSLLDLINEKEIRITELVKQTEVLKETEVRFDLKNQEVNRLMLENSNYAAKIREMAEYIAGMEVNREQMEKEYASVKIKADWAEKFKKEMENSKSEILKLNEILITEKQDNEAMKIQLTGLNSELQNNNFELINELNSLKLKSEESIDVLREELVQMENLSVESINSLQEQIGTLKQQLISDQNNSEKSLELELLNKEITNKIQLLNQQLAEMKIQLDSSESGLQLQMNEVAEIKAENEKLREGNAENLRLLADVDEEKKLLSLNVVSLNQSIDEWSSKFHAVDLKFQEVNLKCNELNVLNESLLSFRENYISAQQQITELERQLLEIGRAHV